MKRARWWMRRRWWPRTFAEYMATPAKIGQRDAILAMCDRMQSARSSGKESER